MYDRRYGEQVLAFEPSGGLMNAALVMRDRETDSWWSIMTGTAIGGTLEGTPLRELPRSRKMQWKDWKRIHPETLVLSIDGTEHDPRDPYLRYFTSGDGFRGLSSPDDRMKDKASIYAFQLDDVAYAVSHSAIEGGVRLELPGVGEIFLFRAPGAPMFASTHAFLLRGASEEPRFRKEAGRWLAMGREFSADAGFGVGDDGGLEPLGGFDTFWYIWTSTHGDVRILQ